MVLDASKTIFLLQKPVKLYAFPLELVLHASKTIFSVLRSVKLSRFIYRNGFGRIQILFFFIAKTSQIVCISSRVGFGRIQNHFIPCQNQSSCPGLSRNGSFFSVLKSAKLCPFARVRIFSIAEFSQIVCIFSIVGFGRIQNHFIPC